MYRPMLILTLLFACWSSAGRAQPIPGDRVDDLGDSVQWLHGPSIPRFRAESVYVLDFWATWCPPCYPMIDRLSALAETYRDAGVVVVGIAVGSDVGVPLERFLAAEKHRIAYTIAQPKDEDELKRSLFHPAFVDPDDFFLPTLVIVDRQGRLAWLSDPADPEHGLEDALAAVVAGNHDLDALAQAARLRLAAWATKGEGLARVRMRRARGEMRQAAKHLVSLVSEMPEVFAPEAAALFLEMVCSAQEENAYDLAHSLLGDPSLLGVPELVLMNRAILFAARDGHRDFELAERIMREALRRRGGDHPDFLYGLAKVAHARGDRAQAETLRERALAAAEAQGWDEQYRRVIGSFPLEAVMAQQTRDLRRRCDAFPRGKAWRDQGTE